MVAPGQTEAGLAFVEVAVVVVAQTGGQQQAVAQAQFGVGVGGMIGKGHLLQGDGPAHHLHLVVHRRPDHIQADVRLHAVAQVPAQLVAELEQGHFGAEPEEAEDVAAVL